MKILCINTLYHPDTGGGAEVIFKTLVEQFKAMGHEVEVITTCDVKDNDNTKYLDNIKIHRLRLVSNYWHYNKNNKSNISKIIWHLIDIFNPFMLYKSYKKIKIINPDIINIHNIQGFSSSIWLAAYLAKIPVAQTLHDQYSICPNVNMYYNDEKCKGRCFKCKLFRFPHLYLTRIPKLCIGVSRHIINIHEKYNLFRNSKKIIIHNRRELVASYNGGGGDVYRIGYIGGIVPAKGLTLLLKELQGIPVDKYVLNIAGTGSGEYLLHIKKLILKYGINTNFMGYVSPEFFYSQIDLLVVPSLWDDTFPTVILEALSNNIPVIGSQRGGIPEIIESVEGCILFEPDNDGELNAILNKIILDKIQLSVTKSDIDFIRMNFSGVKIWANDYLSAFSSIL